jgi:hypothetical protein
MSLMFPLWEIKIFSILRSSYGMRGQAPPGGTWSALTSMYDVVLMQVLQRRADLACKFAGDALAEAAVADDVVEHLSAVDILGDHVIMVGVDDHLAHAADVRVVEEHGERGLAVDADLLGRLLGGRL